MNQKVESPESTKKNCEISFANHALHIASKNLINNLDALSATLPLVRKLITDAQLTSNLNLSTFLNEKGTIVKSTKEYRQFQLSPKDTAKAKNLHQTRTKLAIGANLLPRHFLVSSVSAYDSFLGDMIKTIYTHKPELLNCSERNLTLNEIIKFDSIEAVKEKILDNEIDSLLRKSHSEQIQALSNKFNVPLEPDPQLAKDFVELTERRNIFVHTDGIISRQYLSVCKSHNVELDDQLKLGTRLTAKNTYLLRANDILLEMGIKIIQVLWRKLFPDEIEYADLSLTCITYDLLAEKRNDIAISLLDFGSSNIKRWSDDRTRRVFIINRAQAYKNKGNIDQCLSIINKEDWSSCRDDLHLALAALRDDNESAIRHMLKMKGSNDVGEAEYREWPIFEKLRTTDEFRKAFKEIFKTDFEETFEAKCDSLNTDILNSNTQIVAGVTITAPSQKNMKLQKSDKKNDVKAQKRATKKTKKKITEEGKKPTAAKKSKNHSSVTKNKKT